MNYPFKFYALFFIVMIGCKIAAQSQSTYIIDAGKESIILNRLEIKTRNNYLTASGIKPYSRIAVTSIMQQLDSMYYSKNSTIKNELPNCDINNINSFLMSNSEFSLYKNNYTSKKPILKHYYKQKSNMVDIKEDDFRLIINPIIQYQQGSKGGNIQNNFINQRGINMRGDINSKIGFYFYFTENQEAQPDYVRNFIDKNLAVPSAGYIKQFESGGSDFFDVRGGITWGIFKNINMQLAFDKNFIGNGYRSLLWSDFSTNSMFLKINSQFGKFNYTNMFMELVAQRSFGYDRLYPRKYCRVSYLSYNATKWLNIGLFDGVILGKTDALSLSLFNPILFMHLPSKTNRGINDKSYTGVDIKFNVAKKIQLYHQLMVDRFNFKEIKNKNWNNKYGYQLGVKYIDAMEIKNLDLQLETNAVRPFTYSSTDSFTSYNHYNQPLAHPLGANFKEYIFIVKYQPLQKLFLEAKYLYYQQGLDSTKQGVVQNYGSNISILNQTRALNDGVYIGIGNKAFCSIVTMCASYEIKENLYFDVSFLSRNFELASAQNLRTNVVMAGIRWNIAKREFLF